MKTSKDKIRANFDNIFKIYGCNINHCKSRDDFHLNEKLIEEI